MKKKKIFQMVLLLPVMIMVTMLQYLAIFLSGIISIFIDVLVALAVIADIALLLLKTITGTQAIAIEVVAFILFMLPFIGQFAAAHLERLRDKIMLLIRA